MTGAIYLSLAVWTALASIWLGERFAMAALVLMLAGNIVDLILRLRRRA